MSLFLDIEKKLPGFHLRMKLEAENETMALLGASGSGKTLTLKCIAGIERPDRGRIVIDGVTVFDSEKHINLPPQKRKTGLLFQNYALFPHMTVAENLRAVSKEDPRQMLKQFGLTELADRYPHQLSGGEQQRTALARLLLSRPRILLLDEPFSALDSHLRFQMEAHLRQIVGEFDGTVLLVSHDRDEAFRLSDKIAIVSHGTVQTSGCKHEVFANPVTCSGARLTGCKNISAVKKLPDGRLFASDWGVELNVMKASEAVGIRMHDVRPGEGENSFLCRVTEVIENPFSVTVMLQAAEGSQSIGMELPKEQWESVKSDRLQVCLPKEKLLPLRNV